MEATRAYLDHREKVSWFSVKFYRSSNSYFLKNGYTVHEVDVYSLTDDKIPAVKNVNAL